MTEETDLIRRQISLYVKEDEDTVEHLLRVCFSSYTANPLNLGVMAPSSEGKTHAIVNVTRLFPNATMLAGASPKAFFYEEGVLVDKDRRSIQSRVDDLRSRLSDKGATKEELRAIRSELRGTLANSMTRVDLGGRILVFLEPPEGRLWAALKPLLSHDSLESVYATVDKTSAGSQRSRKILLHGWPACIFASARNEDQWDMWAEIKTRFNVVGPRMGAEKYAAANRLTSRLYGMPSLLLKKEFPEELEAQAKDEVQRIRHMMERIALLGQEEGGGSARDNFTLNLFTDWLDDSFPKESGERMRQFRYLHGYINVSAMMNYEKRARLVVDGQERAIVVGMADVASSLRLILGATGTAIPEYKIAFLTDVVIPAYEAKTRGETVINLKEQQLKIADDGKPTESKPLSQFSYKGLTTREIVECARARGMTMGANRAHDTYLLSLIDSGLVREEPDPDNRRQNLYSPDMEAVKSSRRLAGIANAPMIEPQIVQRALERFLAEIDGSGVSFTIPNRTQAASTAELVDFVLGRSQVDTPEASDEAHGGNQGPKNDRSPEPADDPDPKEDRS